MLHALHMFLANSGCTLEEHCNKYSYRPVVIGMLDRIVSVGFVRHITSVHPGCYWSSGPINIHITRELVNSFMYRFITLKTINYYSETVCTVVFVPL